MVGFYGGGLVDVWGWWCILLVGEVLKLFVFVVLLLGNFWILFLWVIFVVLVVINVVNGLINFVVEVMLVDVSMLDICIFMYVVNYWVVNVFLLLGMLFGGWLY